MSGSSPTRRVGSCGIRSSNQSEYLLFDSGLEVVAFPPACTDHELRVKVFQLLAQLANHDVHHLGVRQLATVREVLSGPPLAFNDVVQLVLVRALATQEHHHEPGFEICELEGASAL